jgi:hypothetical protein
MFNHQCKDSLAFNRDIVQTTPCIIIFERQNHFFDFHSSFTYFLGILQANNTGTTGEMAQNSLKHSGIRRERTSLIENHGRGEKEKVKVAIRQSAE